MIQLVHSAYYMQNIDESYKEKQNMQNQTTSELFTDDKKLKCCHNPNDIPKSAKNLYEKL